MSPRGLAQPLAPVAGTHVWTPRGGTLLRNRFRTKRSRILLGIASVFLLIVIISSLTQDTTSEPSQETVSPGDTPTSTLIATATEAPRDTEADQRQEPTALPDPTATPVPQTGPVTINPAAGGTENLGDGLQYGALLETDGPEPEMGTCFASFTVGDPPLADRIAGHIEITEPTSLRIPENGLLEGESEPIWQFNTNFCQPWRVVEAGINSGDSQEHVTAETPIPTTPATATPEPTPVPGYRAGTHAVGRDITPGIYAGRAGEGLFDSCYWARLSGVSGELDDIIANDNANGQFYIHVLESDGYLEVGCRIVPIEEWPLPDEPSTSVEPGMHLVGRDIAPGTYQGEAGTGLLDSCYWGRLSGLSGELDDIIANDNANGSFYVSVSPTDIALATHCALELVEE